MKSTNRRQLRLDQTKNYYLKMCLLTYILLSFVTLTHSLPPPLQTAHSTQMTLSSAIEEHTKFHDTLLNSAVVPFVKDWDTDKLVGKQEILSGSYFEMIKKLDDSNVDGLTTLADFNKAMSVYNQTQIEDFCLKFPGYIPKDKTKYPESFKLYKYVTKLCAKLCADETDIENIVVQPICRVFAIGYQLSDTKPQLPPSSPAKNTTIEQTPPAKSATNVQYSAQPNSNLKYEDISDNLNRGQEVSLPKNVNDAEKVVDLENVPKDSFDVVNNENIPNENSSPNAGPSAEAAQKIVNGDSNAKSSIVATGNSKENPTPTSKSETKPTVKESNLSEDPISNVQTAEKPVINEQSILGPILNNDDEMNNDEEKTKYTTEESDDSEYNKDKLDINGGDDSNEINENIGDELTAKSSVDQSPSHEQLHNEEDPFTDDTDSNFFTYFMFLLLVCVIAYVVYHNKSKMLALMLEGRRSNTNGRSGLSRRKHTAAYRKLDSNLEEAITSSANGRSTQVIY